MEFFRVEWNFWSSKVKILKKRKGKEEKNYLRNIDTNKSDGLKGYLNFFHVLGMGDSQD